MYSIHAIFTWQTILHTIQYNIYIYICMIKYVLCVYIYIYTYAYIIIYHTSAVVVRRVDIIDMLKKHHHSELPPRNSPQVWLCPVGDGGGDGSTKGGNVWNLILLRHKQH